MTKPLLKFEHLSLQYDDLITFLDDVNFSITQNGLYAICGPSGSGKTSLLNIIAGIIKPTSGQIQLIDEVSNKLPVIHYVTTDDNVIGLLNVFDNIRICNSNETLIHESVKKMGLEAVEFKKCSLLSKGERERVAILMALLSDDLLILIDEPTANLDSQSSKIVFDLFASYSSDKIIIVATHDLTLASNYADEIINIENKTVKLIKKKRIQRDNTNRIFESKKDRFAPLIFLKLAFKSLLTNKLSFLINLFLLSLSFLCIFCSISLANTDYRNSYAKAIINLGEDYLSLSDSHMDKNMSLHSYREKEMISSSDMATLYQLDYDYNPGLGGGLKNDLWIH